MTGLLCRTVLPAVLLLAACAEDTPSPAGPDLAVGAASAPLVLKQISAGTVHTCAVATDGRGYCWGTNRQGELGTGTRDEAAHTRPEPVSGGHRWLDIRAGFSFSCGLTTDNRVFCWGFNSNGELGIGSTAARRLVPTQIAGGRRFRLVRTGDNHACALTTDNVPFCWGSNFQGQIGDGTTEDRRAPVRIKQAGQTFNRLSLGSGHSCAVTTGNVGYCWGGNISGQLGVGHNFRRATPTKVLGGHSWRQVSAGFSHSCGVTTDNLAYCWGSNINGAIGDGTAENTRLSPAAVAGGLRFSGVDPGHDFTCGVTTGDRIYCWGYNGQGQLGLGEVDLEDQRQVTPAPIASGLTFDLVLTGNSHACGVSTAGAGWCWGENHGKLGDGTVERRRAPVAVLGP